MRPSRDQTRHSLLEAAQQEFTEKGYYGASLDDIARRAGMTKGAIYSNFRGKRTLFIESFLNADRQRASIQSPESTTMAAALRTMASMRLPSANARSRRSSALAYELLTLILRDEDELEVLAEVRALLGFILARSLELFAIEAGGNPGYVFDHVAAAFLSLIDGAQLGRTLDEGSLPRELILDLCESLASVPPRHLAIVDAKPSALVERDPVPVPPLYDEIQGDLMMLDGDIDLLGVGRLREMPGRVRRHAVAGRRLTCVVVSSPQHRDMAMLVQYWARGYVDLVRAALPEHAHPDFRLVFDSRGVVPAVLGLDPSDDIDVGIWAFDGSVLADSSSATARVGSRREVSNAPYRIEAMETAADAPTWASGSPRSRDRA